MGKNYDIIIIGAGPVGCTLAERCANLLGWKVLLVEKRDHLGGNCYDEKHASGVRIHKYGPHYFRTNNQKLLDYLSNFTDWIPGDYVVKSQVDNKLYPFPINLTTLSSFFNEPLDKESAEKKLNELREHFQTPKNSEELVLSKVGRELYEAFYLGYTKKQWDTHPRNLAPEVCGRIPIRFNKQERYVDHKFQLMPKEGFTTLFKNMIAHPNIELILNTDFETIRSDKLEYKAMVYSGPIDTYFNYQFGKLDWRSLKFEFVEFPQEFKQPCVQINYPNDFEYTRSVEIKHVTKQKTEHTVISYEYPRSKGEPYYPIPNSENKARYLKYKSLATEETKKHNVFFCGRLATYQYINTDEVIEEALKTFEQIAKQCKR